MMLANPTLRVALATTICPCGRCPTPSPPELIERCLRILDAALRRDFGLDSPRIAVLGLNPHAGEAGVLGDEEIRVIEPVLQALRAEGMGLTGPCPPTPPSFRKSSSASMRCSPCTTTRDCPCSSTPASNTQ